MNFFKLYIGDYQRDTGTLTLAEHGAYMLMLQHYYATEGPLPIGRDLHRLLRAESKVERGAIDAVAARFWRLTDAGLVNDRADEEIAKGRAQAKTNRAIAKQLEATKRATNRARTVAPTFGEEVQDQHPELQKSSKKIEKKEVSDCALKDSEHEVANAQVIDSQGNRQHESCNESCNESCTNREPNHSHSHTRHSVPNGTGVPPSADSPPSPSDPPGFEPDPVKDLFDLGVAILTRGGRSDRDARKLIGLLRKHRSDEEAASILVSAKSSTDPAAYLVKAMQPKPRRVQLC